jgi:hypothetical protein
MTEAFLAYIWQYKLWRTPLVSTDGQALQILKTGQLNTDSGPDFFNAHIQIGETLWVGNVEIHIRASDWNRHGHQQDPAYNNTILHVVFEEDQNIKTADGSAPACLELKGKFDSKYLSKYEYLLHNKNWIPCANHLDETDDFLWKSCLERMAVERLERKSEFVNELLESTQNDWEKAFFISMAGYFGQKVNKLPFQILARSLDPKIIAKHKDQSFQLEALLFGQAGLLDKISEEEYHQSLAKEYRFLKAKYKMVPMPAHLWKYMRLRPAAFPDIRLAQLADLLSKNDFLFSRILESKSLGELEKLLEARASVYWDTHFRFGLDSSKKVKKLGKSTQLGIIINAVIPFMFVYGRNKAEPEFEERALEFLSRLAAEKNYISRGFIGLGKKPGNALESQAMIELKQHYCDFKKCLNCQIGLSIIKTNET